MEGLIRADGGTHKWQMEGLIRGRWMDGVMEGLITGRWRDS